MQSCSTNRGTTACRVVGEFGGAQLRVELLTSLDLNSADCVVCRRVVLLEAWRGGLGGVARSSGGSEMRLRAGAWR